LKLASADIRQISSQLLSDNHDLSVGFGIKFCRPTPPVKKNSSSSASRSPFALHAKTPVLKIHQFTQKIFRILGVDYATCLTCSRCDLFYVKQINDDDDDDDDHNDEREDRKFKIYELYNY